MERGVFWSCRVREFFCIERPSKRTQHFNATSYNTVGSCCEKLWRGWPNACNILQHPKMLQQKFDHFQTWSNTIQLVATCCYREAKSMPYVARNNVAECCVEMLRALAVPLHGYVCNLKLNPLHSTSPPLLQGEGGVGVILVFIASSDLVVFLLVPHSMLTQRRCAPRPPLHICHIF